MFEENEEFLARELEVVELMKRAMDPEDPYNGEDIDDESVEEEGEVSK